MQGVGFRPFVYSIARRHGLCGFVLNDADGVLIEVQGDAAALRAFRHALATEAPALATIDEIVELSMPVAPDTSFRIHRSSGGEHPTTPVSPDAATCRDCVSEICDDTRRRHHYAFTNCTNCGPRFTIATRIPYDRANTTMAAFDMCEACSREYSNPLDRRFHAQPIACPRCGPSLRLVDREGLRVEGEPVAITAETILGGGIVALKGLGGFHLACDATNATAVAELRRRKARDDKPFAVMVGDLVGASAIGHVSDAAAAVLSSSAAPIVLLPRRLGALADNVAPHNRFVGVMLAYTPLHHLLMKRVGRAIVLTSGNVSDEPIAYEDDDALRRLHDLADVFLMHDRPIHIRCDDSVVRIVDEQAYPIRRSRGYAPEPIRLSSAFQRPVLGVGAELKHTFCLGHADLAVVSQHIGDLESHEAMSAFVDGLRHLQRLYDVRPEVVAHDLHPEYLSTKWAQQLEDVALVGVQHHHAHVVSCLADNRRDERVVGLALDGTGYGDDGTLWGCEVLACDARGYDRHLHLRDVPMPGGAAAIRQPWRMAAVYLEAAFGEGWRDVHVPVVAERGERFAPVLQIAARGINSPMASSAGRLFDAAAAICGIRYEVSFEGQAALELEQVADASCVGAYPCRVDDGAIDGVELVAALAEDIAAGTPVEEAAAAFHNGFADALVRACEVVREREGLWVVALSGGTWQNVMLLERVRGRLAAAGCETLIHRRVPTNDAGISLGQAVVASAMAAAL